MKVLYNEIDRYCCDWLSNLMDAGLIAPGKIDNRRIEKLEPDDVREYERVHFFAGIAGWDLALRLAGWPAARAVWTGSCPCQPWSAAGQGKGADDIRHLWPEWSRLIRAVRPATIFGEQVESAIGWGWIDLVHADLAAEGYATRFAVLPACGVGGLHIRQRLWFVADAHGQIGRRQSNASKREAEQRTTSDWDGEVSMGDTNQSRLPLCQCQELPAPQLLDEGRATEQPSRSPWADLEWLQCSDGKARPTQPGLLPLAHGVSARVGKLRAYGNAIIPQVAAEFIKAVM